MSNRVGDESDGWSVARFLMRFARASNTTSGLLGRAFRRTNAIILTHCPDDDRIRIRMSGLNCRLRAFEAFELSVLNSARDGVMSDVQASTLKTLATELHQAIATCAFDAAGPFAAADDVFAAKKYFATRAASIYSGTNETHRNLIARHL